MSSRPRQAGKAAGGGAPTEADALELACQQISRSPHLRLFMNNQLKAGAGGGWIYPEQERRALTSNMIGDMQTGQLYHAPQCPGKPSPLPRQPLAGYSSTIVRAANV